MQGSYLKDVRDQYEDYPYPLRNPDNERNLLQVTSVDGLGLVNHAVYGGKNTFKDKFRVLVAGGGTGDAAIYWAEQLRHMVSARVVYIDLSQASMDIAKKRARVRKLKNIDWHHMSLLDVGSLEQSFDYINCSGVLHHLDDPVAGLKALEGVLKPDGAMGIMVYGEYGRASVYQMQSLLQLINHEQQSSAGKVAIAKKVLPLLPQDNLFRKQKKWESELDANGDIGLYDLLLHSTDRAYTVPQLYAWLDTAGLRINRFGGGLGERLKYMPELVFSQEPKLLEHIKKLPLKQQHAIAEIAMSNMVKHTFIATRYSNNAADINDDEMVPFFNMGCIDGADLADKMLTRPNDPLNIEVLKGLFVTVSSELYASDVLRLIDGKNTIGHIVKVITDKYSTADYQGVRSVLERIYTHLERADLLLLRHKSVPAFATPTELQQRMVKKKKRG